MKSVFPAAEVAVVLALFAGLRVLLRGTPFAVWQTESFGSAGRAFDHSPQHAVAAEFLESLRFVVGEPGAPVPDVVRNLAHRSTTCCLM